jgi:hypothetical protein
MIYTPSYISTPSEPLAVKTGQATGRPTGGTHI